MDRGGVLVHAAISGIDGVILNVRGTSGAGKSYLVRELMKRGPVNPLYGVRGESLFGPTHTKRPLGYFVDLTRMLWVCGHYEVESGGTDRLLGSMGWTRDAVFDLVRRHATDGCDVIFEGLLVSDIERTARLYANGLGLVVIHLTTPLDICLKRIQARRDARNDTRPLSPKKTKEKHREIESQVKRLRALGVDVRSLDCALALRCCEGLLGL